MLHFAPPACCRSLCPFSLSLAPLLYVLDLSTGLVWQDHIHLTAIISHVCTLAQTLYPSL